jgi:hypothetical protein
MVSEIPFEYVLMDYTKAKFFNITASEIKTQINPSRVLKKSLKVADLACRLW